MLTQKWNTHFGAGMSGIRKHMQLPYRQIHFSFVKILNSHASSHFSNKILHHLENFKAAPYPTKSIALNT